MKKMRFEYPVPMMCRIYEVSAIGVQRRGNAVGVVRRAMLGKGKRGFR